MSEKTVKDDGTMRTFEGGATRDTSLEKHDPEGFFSPLAFDVYCAYMHKHRKQPNGEMRDSDNWQSGFGLSVVLKSAWRHLRDWWKIHRGYPVYDIKDGSIVTVEDAVCGVIFNAFSYLHELERAKMPTLEFGSEMHKCCGGCLKGHPRASSIEKSAGEIT
jgi:hypothetical protein